MDKRRDRLCGRGQPGGESMLQETDVLVVGGGPAGLAAAIAARQRGFAVTVADGANPPIRKACGEGLLPDGLEALRALGVTIRESDGCALRGIRFEDDRSRVSGEFSNGQGIGIRREVLHLRMLERASDCGVTFHWNTPITALYEDGVIARGDKMPARWLTGAPMERFAERELAKGPVCVPPPLSAEPLDRFHGNLLGRESAGLHHSR